MPHLLYSSISLILSVTLCFEHALNTIDGVTNYSEFLPFGDPNERMLKVAIGVIDGSYPPKDEETEETTKAQFKIEKSVISPASRRFSSNGLRLK